MKNMDATLISEEKDTAIRNTQDHKQAFEILRTNEVLDRIRNAFEVFDAQSAMLQRSFENLRRNLAEANQQLQLKNKALSDKVLELEQMSSRLQCILDSQADAVLVVGPGLVIERCNPIAEVLLEKPRLQIEGTAYSNVLNGFGNLQALKAALEQGISCIDEQRAHTDANGQKRIVLASVSPIYTQERKIIGAVEILRDVTRIRFLEERMQHQKRMAVLGEMAASVAHEIRNPLGTIEGFARLLKSDLEREELNNHARLASKIIEGAQNLNYVITNLLTYARPMSLQYETFLASQLLATTADQLLPLAAQYKVNLEITQPSTNVSINGDIRQLRQVVVNLARNAIEACKAGGKVSITVAERRKMATISVVDNGCGIHSKDLPKIFDPFFTRKEGGTGLGLSLCHKIVAAHGGDITVSSMVGKGTTINVVLPQYGGK
jgi:signal transduction histidine kinase